MGNRLNFFMTEAVRSLSTNVATSIAATLTMVIALFIVGSVWFVGSWARDKAQQTASDAGIVRVFLIETVTDDQINALKTSIESIRTSDGRQSVTRLRYIDKAGALRAAKRMFKDQPELLDNLAGNPFPAELQLTLIDPRQAKEIASKLTDQPGVTPGEDGVTYGGEVAQKVVRGATVLSWVAGAVIVFFVVAAVFLVRNTIRLSIFSRRREIEVMKLVGASNSFVRWPFMIEGLLCGLSAAVLAITGLWLVKSVFDGIARETLKVKDGLVGPNEAMIALGLIALGVVLGSLGSGLSIRRYLRV